MKIKNIAAGDFVQIKKSLCYSEFKAKQVCEVIDIDHTDTHGFDVLIQGKNCLDWVNHKHLKKPKLQLKQLDQSVFDGEPEQIKWAVVTNEGAVLKFELEPVVKDGLWHWTHSNGCRQHALIGQYNASNWQNSLIERDDIAKELLEVDLSSELTGSELTGSELCKAMLANASKPIMCAVSDISTSKAMSLGNYDLIHDYTDEHSFMSLNQTWVYAVPINNQGEPLTAAEAGL